MIGYIYKIYDNTNGNIYYGSTKESVSRRITGHRAKYKKYIEGKGGSYTKSFDILKNNDYSYSIVEKVEFNEKFELHQKERFYIENNECINKCIPTRTDKEYRENNKDKMREYKKEYVKINKDKIIKQSKEYREINKDKIREKDKEYREINKDKLNEKRKEKDECPHCNKKMRRDSIPRHIRHFCKKI